VARTLRRNPTTRPLVRVLPTIASRTAHSLARHVAHGQAITPRQAVRTLAGQTAAVLSSPRTRSQVVRRARALDRNYHRATHTGQRWTGPLPGGSAAAVRALAPRPPTQGVRAPVRYGPQGRYWVPGGYGTQDGYRVTAGYRPQRGYQAPSARYGAPARDGTSARRPRRRPVPGQGYPRRSYPAGLSIAWVPVPAWRGSQPPPGAYRR
jgi:hypothetical protein